MSTGLAALAASAALAPSYPPSLDPATLAAWLRRSNDIAPEQVVAVTPSAATAILDRIPPTRGRVEVRLRALALTPQSASRSGVAAWEMQLQVECRTGDVRLGTTTGFPTRDSRDDEVTLSPGDPGWRKPQPGTVLESAWRAVCDPSFRPPLAAAAGRIVEARPPPRPPPPAPRAAPSVKAGAHDAVAAAPPIPAPVPGGRGAVQVVSSPVEAETRAAIGRLRRRFGGALDGFQSRIEPAQVRGRTVYRGVISGFASRSDALRFCRTLEKRGQDCLAR